MAVRTRLIDDLIKASVEDGCDRVCNLAAGLDTRPYRMDLPESLEWVEADLGPLIDEKEKLLAGEKPRCRLRRERVDLADRDARAAFLAQATRGAQNVLVLTEGFLVYLDEAVVRAIGRDLHAQPAVRRWILDVHSPALRAMMMQQSGRNFDNAPIRFAPAAGVAWFDGLGWRAQEIRSLVRAAARYRRLPLLLRLLTALTPDPDPRNPGGARWSAIVRFVRA
jgi:methyltransferase (TIGR00027 family)